MNLSPELIIYSERLKNYLKKMREQNIITPENPRSSLGLVEAAQKGGVKLTREDIYHCVHYLREQNEPIASGQKGYFYAIVPEDFDGMIMEQIRIIKERQETLTLAKRLKENLFKSVNSVFESSVGQILNNELNLEPLNQSKENNGGTTEQEETHD
jgi:hypothetical protein